ncbi:MAG: PAS domain S-box protein, partial [Chitinophagaceae bacterium]
MHETTTGLHVLIVEGNPAGAGISADYFSGFRDAAVFQRAGSVEEASAIIGSGNFPDAVIVWFDKADTSLTNEMLRFSDRTPLIGISPFANKTLAASVLENGFSDVIFTEDLNPERLHRSVVLSAEKFSLQKKRSSEQFFRKLFDSNPLPRFIYDVDTLRFLDVNQAAIKAYGYSRAEFLGMTLLDIRPKDEIENFMQALKHNMDLAVGVSYSRHLTKTGGIIDVEVQGSPIDFQGKNARAVNAIDITERRRMEREIQSSENKLKALVHAAGDLIGIMDVNGKLTYTSPNHISITGWQDEELKNHTAKTLIHPEDQEMVSTYYRSIPYHKTVYSEPYRMKCADGNYIWLETIATSALDNPAVEGFVLNSRDITSRIQNQNEIEEINKRLTALSKATSDAIYDFDYESNRITFAGSGYHALIGSKLRNNSADYSFFESALHQEDQQRVIHFMDKAMRSTKKNHFELEYRFLKPDGRYAYILDRFEIIRKNGKAIAKVGAMQD